MDPAIMRAAALIALLALAGCKGLGLGSFDTGGYATPAGLSQMNSQSPDAEDDKWLKSYYGGNHGWGWDVPTKSSDPNCSFYNTCGGSGGGGGGGFYGGQDNPHNNTASDW